MGNRISIQFKNKDSESPVLFSHWGGEEFKQEAEDYIEGLKNSNKDNSHCSPLDRLEPGTVMVDFIRHITKGLDIVDSDLYIEKEECMGDNSDNGHFIIDIDTESDEEMITELKNEINEETQALKEKKDKLDRLSNKQNK